MLEGPETQLEKVSKSAYPVDMLNAVMRSLLKKVKDSEGYPKKRT